MRIGFRVDASFEIGSGHIMRCLTLAKALREREAECFFLSRNHQGNLNKFLRSQGFVVSVLPLPEFTQQTSDQPSHDHSHWLGVDWRTDAQQTIELLDDGLVDWLVIDHYAIDKRWESQLRPHTKNIMVIDDLADREHDCDLLLDQNLIKDFKTRYDCLLVSSCARLLGPKYALLQAQYAELRPLTPLRSGPVREIFAYFGASDLHNLTGLTISAFLKLKRQDLRLNVVINPQGPNAVIVRDQVRGHTNIALYDNLPSLAPLIANAHLAIGATGVATWERFCLGLPAIVVTAAENQRPIADSLNNNGLVRWVGDHQSVTIETLSQAIFKELDGCSLHAWSTACSDIVDGKGADRVASVLNLSPSMPLKIRTAELADELLVLDWANDPLVRRNSFIKSQIQPNSHRQWFYSRLQNSVGCKLYIIETQAGVPIGQVRFERGEGMDWEIHFGLWVGARGRDLGSKVVKLALESLRNENEVAKVVGFVKPDNTPSKRVFERLGFLGHREAAHLVFTLNL